MVAHNPNERIMVAVLKRLLPLLLITALMPNDFARSETIIASLSNQSIEIASDFTGTTLALFGSIERDGGTAARGGQYSVIVEVNGPASDNVIWRKVEALGIWFNRYSQTILAAPSLRVILASQALAKISEQQTFDRFQIGFSNMIFLHPAKEEILPKSEAFNEAFIAKKKLNNLYQLDEQGVKFLSSSLFKALIPLPANIPVGDYSVTVFLFVDTIMLNQVELTFIVKKKGIEQTIFQLAKQQPLIYGSGVVILAIAIGLIGSVVFRRG